MMLNIKSLDFYPRYRVPAEYKPSEAFSLDPRFARRFAVATGPSSGSRVLILCTVCFSSLPLDFLAPDLPEREKK